MVVAHQYVFECMLRSSPVRPSLVGHSLARYARLTCRVVHNLAQHVFTQDFSELTDSSASKPCVTQHLRRSTPAPQALCHHTLQIWKPHLSVSSRPNYAIRSTSSSLRRPSMSTSTYAVPQITIRIRIVYRRTAPISKAALSTLAAHSL